MFSGCFARQKIGFERVHDHEARVLVARRVSNDGEHLLLRRKRGAPGRHEARDHPGHVLAGGSHHVFVIGVGVGERRDLVLHPLPGEELHELGLERHALPKEDLRPEAMGRVEHVSLLPDGGLVVGAVKEDFLCGAVATRVDEHRLAAGGLDHHVVTQGVEQGGLQPFGAALAAGAPAADRQGHGPAGTLDFLQNPRGAHHDHGEDDPGHEREVPGDVAARVQHVPDGVVEPNGQHGNWSHRQVPRRQLGGDGEGLPGHLSLGRAQAEAKAQPFHLQCERPSGLGFVGAKGSLAELVELRITCREQRASTQTTPQGGRRVQLHGAERRQQAPRLGAETAQGEQVVDPRHEGTPAAHGVVEATFSGHARGRHFG
jgi:hypothetical protein